MELLFSCITSCNLRNLSARQRRYFHTSSRKFGRLGKCGLPKTTPGEQGQRCSEKTPGADPLVTGIELGFCRLPLGLRASDGQVSNPCTQHEPDRSGGPTCSTLFDRGLTTCRH
ncbi:unnamed protein product, partial [Nesidiocoris tenuis]